MYVGCSSLCSGCILLLGVRREYGIPLKKEVSKCALKKRCAFLQLLRAAFLAWKLSHTIRSMEGRQEVDSDGWFKYLLMFLGRTFHYIYQFDFWSPLLWGLRRDLQVIWRNIPRGYSEGFSTASGRTRLVSLLSPFPSKDRQGFRQRNLYGTGTRAVAEPEPALQQAASLPCTFSCRSSMPCNFLCLSSPGGCCRGLSNRNVDFFSRNDTSYKATNSLCCNASISATQPYDNKG